MDKCYCPWNDKHLLVETEIDGGVTKVFSNWGLRTFRGMWG